MNFKVIHTTHYKYKEAVSLCYNIARLVPRNTRGQTCNNTHITISPTPDVINEYEDFFGNKVIYFTIQNEHRDLSIKVESEVFRNEDADHKQYGSIPWEEVREHLFTPNLQLLE